MSYYELPAEGRGYYLFEHRRLNDGAAHFHSALEFVFVERGKAEVNIDGESRTLNPGEACFSEGFRVHAYHDTPDNIVYWVMRDTFSPFFFPAEAGRFRNFFRFRISVFWKPSMTSVPVRTDRKICERRLRELRKFCFLFWRKPFPSKNIDRIDFRLLCATFFATQRQISEKIFRFRPLVPDSVIHANTFLGFYINI